MQLELNSLGSMSQPGFPSQFPEMAIVITLVGIHPDFFLCFYMKSTYSSEKFYHFVAVLFFFFLHKWHLLGLRSSEICFFTQLFAI